MKFNVCQTTYSRLLKKYNFVIANGVKQSLFEIAKSALSLVLRLLQDFVLGNDIGGNFVRKRDFSSNLYSLPKI